MDIQNIVSDRAETFDPLSENGTIIYINVTVQKAEEKWFICNVPSTLELWRSFQRKERIEIQWNKSLLTAYLQYALAGVYIDIDVHFRIALLYSYRTGKTCCWK